MTLTPEGGAAIPVSVTTTRRVQGGSAIPVYGYMTAPTDGRPALGGPALPVRVLTAADLKQNGGMWTLEGRPHAMPVYTAPATTMVQGGPAIAVYPVNAWPTVVAPVVPSTLLNGLILSCELDEANGARSDDSGNGLNLSDNNAVGSAVGIAGVGTAANFSGANWLSHANDALLQMGPDKDYTISVWFRPANITNTQGLVCRWENPYEYALYFATLTVDLTVQAPGAVSNGLGALRIVNEWVHALGWVDHTAGKSWLRINNGTAQSRNIGAIAAQDMVLQVARFGGANYFTGRMAQLRIWNRVLTSTEQTSLWSWGGGLPYPFSASGSVSNLKNMVFQGDSLTMGNTPGASTPYPDQLMPLLYADPGANEIYQNRGTGLWYVSPEMLADGTNCDARYYAGYGKNACILWGGTNDLSRGDTAATVWANIKTFCAARKAKGFDTVVLTITPRADAGWDAGKETQRGLLNTSITGGDASISAVADVAAAPNLADPNNLTYYQDKIHLTTAGYTEVANVVKTTLQGLGY